MNGKWALLWWLRCKRGDCIKCQRWLILQMNWFGAVWLWCVGCVDRLGLNPLLLLTLNWIIVAADILWPAPCKSLPITTLNNHIQKKCKTETKKKQKQKNKNVNKKRNYKTIHQVHGLECENLVKAFCGLSKKQIIILSIKYRITPLTIHQKMDLGEKKTCKLLQVLIRLMFTRVSAHLLYHPKYALINRKRLNRFICEKLALLPPKIQVFKRKIHGWTCR